MSELNRPKLSVDKQIDHLVSKGTRFDEKFSETEARMYLHENNNYFRLRAYRKNFAKIPFGPKAGMYQNLDFAHLVDLAIIDTRLRNIVIEMCLNIEHFVKVKLLKLVSDSDEDGYSVVSDYFASLVLRSTPNVDRATRLNDEINRNCDSVYCGELIEKYNGQYPVWVFVEIISFGSFIDFYSFCSTRFDNSEMKRTYSMLMEVKSLRNAAAHNNCIINDLCQKTTRPVQYQVSVALGKIKSVSKQKRDTKMCNPRIRQIVTMLYTHTIIVYSLGMHKHISERLEELGDRLFRNFDYSSNPTVKTTFDFLQIIIDNWYPTEVS